ncbi:hypothetical protein [Candidatus Nitrospira bockiana]
MVELIGVITIVAMSWVLASGMANESDAEHRRESAGDRSRDVLASGTAERRDAA